MFKETRPKEAYMILEQHENAVLIDVRRHQALSRQIPNRRRAPAVGDNWAARRALDTRDRTQGCVAASDLNSIMNTRPATARPSADAHPTNFIQQF